MELHGDGARYNDPAIVTGIGSIEVLDLHLHVCPVIFHTLMQFTVSTWVNCHFSCFPVAQLLISLLKMIIGVLQQFDLERL